MSHDNDSPSPQIGAIELTRLPEKVPREPADDSSSTNSSRRCPGACGGSKSGQVAKRETQTRKTKTARTHAADEGCQPHLWCLADALWKQSCAAEANARRNTNAASLCAQSNNAFEPWAATTRRPSRHHRTVACNLSRSYDPLKRDIWIR